MAFSAGYLVDTNVLLRLSRENDSQNSVVQRAVGSLGKEGTDLYFSMQNVAEFWNVCTRPVQQNGFGLAPEETSRRVGAIEKTMTLLAGNEEVYRVRRGLVTRPDVRGVQVHDARLAALMQVHGVSHLLTFNQADFARTAGCRQSIQANSEYATLKSCRRTVRHRRSPA